jgi:hypothetical protein
VGQVGEEMQCVLPGSADSDSVEERDQRRGVRPGRGVPVEDLPGKRQGGEGCRSPRRRSNDHGQVSMEELSLLACPRPVRLQECRAVREKRLNPRKQGPANGSGVGPRVAR